MATPTPVFPGAVATDQQLKVANNLITTTLKVAANPTDTILFVNSTAGFVPNCLVSIDKEILAVTSVTASPNPMLTVATGGRGFDGTAAAQHPGGAKVSMLIDAWHHNVLSAEIKAIETALGANLANVGKFPYLISTDFRFAARTPGGSLTAGANVVTLSPVPNGVNGTDQSHWLYISGGTGTAEAVLITGGTAVAGAASGTVIVTCANSHSGAWTIQSATAGIQEAIQSLVSANQSNVIIIPAGSYEIYSTITMLQDGVALQGARSRQNGSVLIPRTPNIASIALTGRTGCSLFDLELSQGTPGSTADYAMTFTSCNRCTCERICALNYSNGLLSDSCTYCTFRDIDLIQPSHVGIRITGGNSIQTFDNMAVVAADAAAACLQISQTADVMITNGQFIGGANGLLVDPGGGQGVFSVNVVNSYFDHNKSNGVNLLPSGAGSILRLHFLQCWMASCPGIGLRANAAGGPINEVFLTQCEISDNTLNGINFSGTGCTNININGCAIFSNGAGSGIVIDNGMTDVVIQGNNIGNDSAWPTVTQQYGVFLGNATRVVVSGNVFKNNVTAAIGPPSPVVTDAVITGNTGVDSAVQTVASAAAFTAGWGPLVRITGTTTITTINGGWAGRTIRLMKADAGSVTIGGGGNIPLAHTLASGGALTLTYDSTAWY